MPDPRPPGEVRWQQVVRGWLVGLAVVAGPVLASLLVTFGADELGWYGLVAPSAVVLGVVVPLVAYVWTFVRAVRTRRKGLAVGIALFGATLVLLSAACFVLVFANFPY